MSQSNPTPRKPLKNEFSPLPGIMAQTMNEMTTTIHHGRNSCAKKQNTAMSTSFIINVIG